MLTLYTHTMADVFTPKKRSEIMSRITSKHTLPVLRVRKALYKAGFRFRINVSELPGKPDLANKKRKIAIFVNGCFWHQHKDCKRSSIPKSNKNYWVPKLKKNVAKQKLDIKNLTRGGWKVGIIWECQTKKNEFLEKWIRKNLC